MPKSKLSRLEISEWLIAIALTAFALTLHFVRIRYAGPLWRDEIAALNLARMESWGDIWRYFPHEAFPLLFPAILRAYTSPLGTSNFALRIFGFLVAAMFLGIIWTNARLTRRHLPLVTLTLIGTSPLFLIWGDTIRAYGLAS